jgi:hypothetical protein
MAWEAKAELELDVVAHGTTTLTQAKNGWTPREVAKIPHKFARGVCRAPTP